MQTAPQNWNTLLSAAHRVEYRLVLDGQEYFGANIVGTPVLTKPLLDEPAIGRVCSATLQITIHPFSQITIPKAARAYYYCRLVSGNTVTDWIPQGAFYISSRSGRASLSLTLRDDMIKAGQTYFDKTAFDDWPQRQVDVVADIASIMGLTLDARTNLAVGSAYQVKYLDPDVLISEILAYIGASNGGSWIITESGKLRLVKLRSPDVVPAQNIGTAHKGYTDTGVNLTISRVTLTDDNNHTFTAGNDTGLEIAAFDPFADQTVVNDLASNLSGVVYVPHRIDSAWVDPLLELGDTISAVGAYGDTLSTVICSEVVSCNIGYTATIEAGATQFSEEEYPYQTMRERQAERTTRSISSRIDKQSDQIALVVEESDGSYRINSANIVLAIEGDASGVQIGADHIDLNGYVTVSSLGSEGATVIDGSRIQTGTINAERLGLTDALYAGQGEVSELTVDRLLTSRRIKKFLLGDPSDDSYIQIAGHSIQFVAAEPSGMHTRLLSEDGTHLITEDNAYLDGEVGGSTNITQAVNRYGAPIYWQQDISGAEISAEGYPYIDGVQVFTTTKDTGFPVYTYVYDELLKAEYKFVEDPSGDFYSPVQIWGAGSGYGDHGKGRIEKRASMFRIGYTTRTGVEESIEMNDDGWIDIKKTRKPLRFDFRNISRGSFTEVIDGGEEATYSVGFDLLGRINRITDQQGHTTEVVW